MNSSNATGPFQFPPLLDRPHFPLLTSGAEYPCEHLLGCKGLTFFAPENASLVRAVVRREPLKWHQYGDARWPSLSSWIEIDTGSAGFTGFSGVLVINHEIPEAETDAFHWVARNGPLHDLFPEERGEAVILRRLEALRQQANSAAEPDDPADLRPRFVQSYCIYREPANPG